MHDSISSSALCALLGVRRQSTRNSDRTFCFLNRRRFQPAWERAYLVGSAAAACATPPPVRKHVPGLTLPPPRFGRIVLRWPPAPLQDLAAYSCLTRAKMAPRRLTVFEMF